MCNATTDVNSAGTIPALMIEEVLEENDGIYNWSWFPTWDDRERAMIVESDSNLWREKILRNDWMVNNPTWNVNEIGMYYLGEDGEVSFTDDLTILVDKDKSVKDFVMEYKEKWDGPIYIEWIEVRGFYGGFYEDVDTAIGPFEFLIEVKRKEAELLEDQERGLVDSNRDNDTMAYCQEIANSIEL